nr:FxSxx-COOH system tetratricopeptide repeat protein [Nocardia sp. GTS18]
MNIGSAGNSSVLRSGPFIVGDIPREPTAFVRREIVEALEGNFEGATRVLVAALTGMRGIGKTHVAAAHARKVQERGGSVLWLNAATARDLLAGLTRAAALLDVADPDGDHERTLDRLWNCIARLSDPKLIVFDNAQDPDLVHRYLPKDPGTRVVITSTDHRFHELASLVPVDVYTREESVAYLNQRTGQDDQTGADSVAAELGDLPLAVAAAASVIRNNHLSYRDYLELLRAPDALDEALKKAAGQQYPEAATTALRLNLDTVRAQGASLGVPKVLAVVAALDPNGLAVGTLTRLSGISARAAVAECVNSSILTFSAGDSVIAMHSLLRRMVQRDAERSGQVPSIATDAHCILEGMLTADAIEAWRRRIDISIAASHVEALWSWSCAHLTELGDSELLQQLLQLRATTVEQLTAISELSQAVRIGTTLLPDYLRLLGPEHPDTIASREGLANAYWLAGRTDEAIDLLERTVADEESLLGRRRPSAHAPRNALALAYESAGRLHEAVHLLEQTLAENERSLGPDDPATLRTCHDLAFTYRSSGRLDEAVRLFERVVTGSKRVLGEDDPETLSARDGLAGTYMLVNRTPEGIELFYRTLADRTRVLGPDHPHTLMSGHNLAYAYRSANRVEESILLFKETLAHQERLLGLNHLHTLTSCLNLADTYMSANQRTQAIALYQRAVSDFELTYGSDHPVSFQIRTILARALGTEYALSEVVLGVLRSLSWEVLPGSKIAPGNDERASWADLIIPARLRQSIKRINPQLSDRQVDRAIETIRSSDSCGDRGNARIQEWIVNGLRLTERRGECPDERYEIVHLINQVNPNENEFMAATEVKICEGVTSRRLDLVLYVNGLPLVIVELKDATNNEDGVRDAYNQLKEYGEWFEHSLRHNLIWLVTDGFRARYGTRSMPYEQFAPWNVAVDGRSVPQPAAKWDSSELSLALQGMLNRGRLIELVSIYLSPGLGTPDTFAIAKPHQYFAVRKALARTVNAMSTDGRAGVVWHTAGSGKSATMEFYVSRLLNNPTLGNPTVVVIGDRSAIVDQLYYRFKNCSLLSTLPVRAESSIDLRTELAGRKDRGLIFTTLQKFRTAQLGPDGVASPSLFSDRRNIVVIAHEAHRGYNNSLYGFIRNVKDALPNATMIAFTSTPMSEPGRDIREVFGEYIDKYDIVRSERDGMTVPVYYEGHLIPMDLPVEIGFNSTIDANAELLSPAPDASNARHDHQLLNAAFGAPDRVRKISDDIVNHWEKRSATFRKDTGVTGKSIIVCPSRRIAAMLYREIVSLRPDWHDDSVSRGSVKVMVSSSIDGPELIKHRLNAAERENLSSRLRDPDDELSMVIVCDSLLTGLDVPAMHTVYIDRPMQGPRLLQLLSRVNRPFRNKTDGLIVAYTPIAEELREAIANYTEVENFKAESVAPRRDFQQPLDGLHTTAYRWQSLCRTRTALSNEINRKE